MKIAPKPVPLTPRHPSPWITVQEAARYMQVGTDLIYNACTAGQLRHVKLGAAAAPGRRTRKVIRTQYAWCDEWAERNAYAGAAAK